MKIFLLIPALAINLSAQPPALLYDPPDGNEPVAQEIRAAFKPAEVVETKTSRQNGRSVIIQRIALDPADPITPVRKEVVAPEANLGSVNIPPDIAVPHQLLMLSATVYPGPYTRLEWTTRMKDGTTEHVVGFSNIDFNHFTGISSFIGTDGKEHVFNMGIGTEEAPATGVPRFRTDTPTFIPDRKGIATEALLTVDSLHKLYAIEKQRLVAAYESRKRSDAARKAELALNPPKPKDLIIRYRAAKTSPATQGGSK